MKKKSPLFPSELKQRKYGLIDKIAPQISDDEDDRKPYPNQQVSSTTMDDPMSGSNSQSMSKFKILLLFNMISAFINGISDCDETFNYWEPLHYFFFGKDAFQTWEYSPEFGLRSWFYIFVHSIFALPHLIFMSGPMVFFFIRIIFAIVNSCSQLWLYESIQLVFGGNISELWLWFTVLSTGNFISATAFLPSTTCMYLTNIWVGCWLRNYYNWATYVVAFSALFSWPFSVGLAIPLALDQLFLRKNMYNFFCYCLESFIIINFVILGFDWYIYGWPKAAWFNIMTYNIFSDKGPDLYGVEPISYYLLNLTLNFGPLWILSFLSIPLVAAIEYIISIKIKGYKPVYHLLLYMTPLYVWIFIFFLQPHKEERFMFPAYPLFMLTAAISVGSLQKVYACFLQKKIKIPFAFFGYLVICTSAIFGFSRLCALTLGYSGVMDTYRALYQITESRYKWMPNNTILCIGKEWHRYPSKFYVPRNISTRWLQSEYRGQLPGIFGPWPQGFAEIVGNFNDDNAEVTSRYYANPSNAHKFCNFLIDSDFGTETEWEPLYHLTDNWDILYETNIVNKEMSHWFYKSFYVPYKYEETTQFAKYRLLKSNIKKLEAEPV